MEENTFLFRNFTEFGVFGIDPDFRKNAGLFASPDGPGNDGHTVYFPEIFLFESLTAHAGRYHPDYFPLLHGFPLVHAMLLIGPFN
jgi:hypothetical protein